MNLNQLTLPSRDIARSVAFYRGMGFSQIVDAPHYARFECTEGDATFSLHLVSQAPKDTGVVTYFECAHLDDTVARLVADGYEFASMPADQRWLWREARLADPDGNVICLFHAGANRKHPPWRLDSAHTHA